MIIKVEFWQLVSLLLSFLGFVAVVGKVLLSQIDKRLDTKFTAQETAQKAGDKAIHDTLRNHIAEESKNTGQLIELERQFLNWKGDLPLQYVRREDFIRNQTIIESKLDGLAVRLENAQLKGISHA